MQVRCTKCHMPISLSKDVVYAALDITIDEDLSHYDIRCPHCRKTNRVSVEQLKHAAPGYQRERDEEAE